MRIVNQAEELAVRLLYCGDHDATADFGDWFVDLATMRNEMIDRRLYVIYAKVRPRAVCHIGIRVEPEFVTANVEAHVKPDIKRRDTALCRARQTTRLYPPPDCLMGR